MVSDFTIDLQRPRKLRGERGGSIPLGIIKKALPFFRSRPGCYVHRVRCGRVYKLGARMPHTAFQMWCGTTGFISERKDGELLADVPAGAVCCATCEGRAVGAGLLGAPIIAGHPVKYSPRI